jgi:hypothetical protein
MTNLHNFHLGQSVTLANSTTIMVIEHFAKNNRDEWQAVVRFACDHRRTQMTFPISMLQPISAKEEDRHVQTIH